METAKDLLQIVGFGEGNVRKVSELWICLRIIGMPQGHYGYSSVTIRSTAERPQDTPGQHRDASGHLKGHPGCVYRPCGHSRMLLMDLYISCGCQLIDKVILLT